MKSDTILAGMTVAPPATLVPEDTGSDNPTVIRDAIVDPFSEGTRHSCDEFPTSDISLPSREVLQDALAAVEAYLSRTGCSLIADAHLQGMSAVVETASTGIMYTYLDADVFKGTVTRVVEATPGLGENVGTASIVQAVVLAHSMEFEVSMSESGIRPMDAASWATFTGQETSNPTGTVFSTPHPLRCLDTHDALPERALGLTAGIQQLTLDLDTVYSQRDVAIVYLLAYLTGHGVSSDVAYTTVARWYDVPEECVLSLARNFRERIKADGLPATDPERMYYLTESAVNALRAVK